MGILDLLTFKEALIISLSAFFVDWISGVTAGIRSGRHIKSSIMREMISDKAVKYFHFILIGLAFSYTGALNDVAPVVVIIPAVPEIVSIFENVKIIRSKIDTKGENKNGTNSSQQ